MLGRFISIRVRSKIIKVENARSTGIGIEKRVSDLSFENDIMIIPKYLKTCCRRFRVNAAIVCFFENLNRDGTNHR